jgi:hypothetical protein
VFGVSALESCLKDDDDLCYRCTYNGDSKLLIEIGEGQEVMNENQMKFFEEQLEKKLTQFKISKYEQQNTIIA